ncbi:type VI secretion system baseplate subunit TssF [Pseudomonas rhizoryzae]|uniref:type VI secretion system baseplate subunit TssF n=1 Tax=Pseudomonas rhizoryzae TaxID=2571129 RepID=UPI00073758E4|nr:type VI secretion system baseplate subunit TssF [Pseudomonas rhizoryzae]KTT32349.1 type VI secretion protein [Pseudomonas psychrotolerans]KTT35524.1 type VI secretion protein [Pseudomonas psychrotolerans]KTT70797.1 type VI secretion protein [Pseudomonas psychrotolerans]
MSFNHYYQSELAELRQLGARFAERNPALAPFLGQGGQDPDVERLLEGFAFLTGRLRQKLDDELPELTHSLLNLLWPHYLRPLPSCAILEFDPLPAPGAPLEVPRGTEVESQPLDEVSCRFRTCFAAQVQPLRVDEVGFAPQGDGARLTVRLGITGTGTLAAMDLRQLPLHLAGDRALSQDLYLALLHNLTGLSLVPVDGAGEPLVDDQGRERSLPLAAEQVQPLGFGEDEALLPYPPNAFRGYRHLQEYFAFPEKFLFVTVQGLAALLALPDEVRRQARGLELRFEIRRIARQPRLPSRDNLRLHCVPVVNLFRHDALPIRLDGKRDEYPLFPAGHGREHLGVFAVERVTGWQPGGLGHRDYLPFESFAHDLSFGGQGGRPHYAVRQRTALLHGGIDTYLAFGDPGNDQDTLSIELTCTNQNLPLRLRAGDLCLPTENTPGGLAFRNLAAPTASHAPVLSGDRLWQLVSNLSLNYLSLTDVEALRTVLASYDLPRQHDRQAERISRQRLAALRAISHRPVDRLYRGLPIRGIATQLEMDASGFRSEGELYLFASVLNEFFALYASLNSFHQLSVRSLQGEVYLWTPRMGQQPLI